MAYHKADNERWRQLDFVLGYEVKVSGTNPNVCPLCMELEGKYPKEFEFVGWHPHCRCHAIPILEKPEDFLKRQQAFLQGQHVPPLGAVKQPPQNFLQHLKDNQDRLQQANKRGTLPYFIRDNYKVGKRGKLTPIFASPKTPATPSIQERAKARHEARTPEEVRDIKRRFEERAQQLEWKLIEESLERRKIDTLVVKRLKKPLSERRIINKISGGDLTEGSCSSLALTYAGNRRGLDVRDFRGGKSQDFFSDYREILKITRASGGIEIEDFDGFKAAKNALAKVERGKEYYFTAGSHAAIVRKAKGKGYEYLELQDQRATGNGFHKLTKAELKERFGVKTRHTVRGHKIELSSCLFDIEEIDGDALSRILRYINTKKSKQMRGISGEKK